MEVQGMAYEENAGILGSRFWRALLVIAVALILFVGPTYFVYLLVNVLNVNYFVSMLVGFIILVGGFVLLYYFMRKDVVL